MVRSITWLRARSVQRWMSTEKTHPPLIPAVVRSVDDAECERLRLRVNSDGFAVTREPLLSPGVIDALRGVYPGLFRGDFPTGNYPDEWHWREGISLPGVTREICNAYKAHPAVAAVVLSSELAEAVAGVCDWPSVRIAQDDVIWKPPVTAAARETAVVSREESAYAASSVVGFHQDAPYITSHFEPDDGTTSVTVWMALDDATEETGCLEYAVGSHRWTDHDSADDYDFDTSTSSEKSMGSFHARSAGTYRSGLPGHHRDADVVATPCPSGHAVWHHPLVWHGSGPNRSTRMHRRALVGHYLRGDVRWRDDGVASTTPWGSASYIYGRYRSWGTAELDESFFPVLYGREDSGQERTAWVDDYLEQATEFW